MERPTKKIFRYTLRCRVCKARWVEAGTWYTTVGLTHPCWLNHKSYKETDSPVNGYAIIVAKEIKGTYNPDVKCDGRCMGALGHNCDCSCGGENHGKNNEL